MRKPYLLWNRFAKPPAHQWGLLEMCRTTMPMGFSTAVAVRAQVRHMKDTWSASTRAAALRTSRATTM
jgi:hypothetical protein